MANYLLFPPQKFSLQALEGQFPQGFPNKKYFFQPEVRKITDDRDVIFGLIGYPAWRRGQGPREHWRIGEKVRGEKIRDADPNDPDETMLFDPNEQNTWVALSNNEVFLGPGPGLFGKISAETEKRQISFMGLYDAILKNKKSFEKAALEFKSRIFKNPHVYYDVLLTDGTNSELYVSNPCPPNQPGE
jgi:hypothetical protein